MCAARGKSVWGALSNVTMVLSSVPQWVGLYIGNKVDFTVDLAIVCLAPLLCWYTHTTVMGEM